MTVHLGPMKALLDSLADLMWLVIQWWRWRDHTDHSTPSRVLDA